MAEATALKDAAALWRLAKGRGTVIEASSVGPVRVLLRSVVERRSVRFRYERAPAGEPEGQHPPVDPWALEVQVPAGVSAWRHEQELDEARTVVLCPRCVAGRERKAQTLLRGDVRYEEIVCTLCAGSCRAFAIPVVEIDVETLTGARVVERRELPVELLLEIGERSDDGRRVHEERGETLRPRGAHGAGYRALPPRVSPEVDPTIDALLLEQAEAARGRILDQVLQVSEVPVLRVELASGDVGWIYRDWPWTPSRRGKLGPALRGAAKWVGLTLVGGGLILLCILSASR